MKYLILSIVSILLSNCIIQPMPDNTPKLNGKYCSDTREICYEFSGNSVSYANRFEHYEISEHYVVRGENYSEGGVLTIDGWLYPVDYTVDNVAFKTYAGNKTFTYYKQ